jgi:hypothetical protein
MVCRRTGPVTRVKEQMKIKHKNKTVMGNKKLTQIDQDHKKTKRIKHNLEDMVENKLK